MDTSSTLLGITLGLGGLLDGSLLSLGGVLLAESSGVLLLVPGAERGGIDLYKGKSRWEGGGIDW